MPAQRPPNVAVRQLLCADFSCEGTIGLIEHVLAAYFDFRLQVLADEEEEEPGGGDHYFCFWVEGSFVEVVDDVCDRFDSAVPNILDNEVSLVAIAIFWSSERRLNILKFPPTKNLRGAMIAVTYWKYGLEINFRVAGIY